MLYIIVNKLSNVEIYAQGIYEDDSYKNAVSGTVLDHESGLFRKQHEFYLISSNMKQGISLPCKYSIMYDSVGETMKKVQLLSYKLCYLYFNLGGPIRYPAPILYAHKLANLVAEKNELDLINGPEREPIKVHEIFNQAGSTLFFI